MELEGEREDKNCRHLDSRLKTLKNYIVLQRKMKIFIASISTNSRKVLKEEMRIVCCLYMLAKVNIQGRRLCS